MAIPLLRQRKFNNVDHGTDTKLPCTPEGEAALYTAFISSHDLRPNSNMIVKAAKPEVLPVIHFLNTLFESQSSNLGPRHPGYEHRPAAYLVLRVYRPQKLQPKTFGLLWEVVRGALPQGTAHNPNVHFINAPPEERPGSGADSDGVSHNNDVLSELMGGAWEDEEPAPKRARPDRPAGGKANKSSAVLSINAPERFAHDLFKRVRRQELYRCVNAKRLLPPQRDEPAPGTDLRALPDEIGAVAYLSALLRQLVILPVSGAPSVEGLLRPLTDEQRLAAPPLGFKVDEVSELRIALSRANALEQLRRWLADHPSDRPEAALWGQAAAYTNPANDTWASPPGVQTYVIEAQDGWLERLGELELPRPLTLRELLNQPACQVALIKHTDKFQTLGVLDAVTRLGLEIEWQPGTAREMQRLRDRLGALSVPQLSTEQATIDFLLAHIYSERVFPGRLSALVSQLERERDLLQPETGTHRRLLKEQAYEDLMALVHSGLDSNAVLQVVTNELTGEGRIHDLDAELRNFRACFARPLCSDLGGFGEFLAKYNWALRLTSGLHGGYEREAWLTVLVLSASWADSGERVHLQFVGDPGAGKTAVIKSAQNALYDGLVESTVYQSAASMRDPDPTRARNLAVVHPEYGQLGDHKNNFNDRAVELSRLSETENAAKMIRRNEKTGKRETDMVSWARSWPPSLSHRPSTKPCSRKSPPPTRAPRIPPCATACST